MKTTAVAAGLLLCLAPVRAQEAAESARAARPAGLPAVAAPVALPSFALLPASAFSAPALGAVPALFAPSALSASSLSASAPAAADAPPASAPAPAAAAPAAAPVIGNVAAGPAATRGADPLQSLGTAERALTDARARPEKTLDALFGEGRLEDSEVLAPAPLAALGPASLPPLPRRTPAASPRARAAAAWRTAASAFQILPDPKRNRAFWLWTLGQAVLNAGMTVNSTAMPKIIGEGPAQAGDRGLNRAGIFAAQAASSLLTGPAADRRPPLAVLTWSYAGAGLLLLAAPVLFVAGCWSFGIFTLIIGAANFALAAAQNAGAVVYNRILGDDVARYNKANGWLTVINSAVGVVAPLAGAALLVRLGPAAVSSLSGLFGLLHLGAFPKVDAAAFGAVLSCAVYASALLAAAVGYRRFLKVPAAAGAGAAIPAPAAPRSIARELLEGLRLAFANRVLRRLMLFSALRVAAGDALIFTLIPSFLTGLPAVPLAFALIVSAGNLGTAAASGYLALAKNRRSDAASDSDRLERQGRRSALLRAVSWLFYAGLFFSGSVYLAAALLFLNALFQVPGNIIWGSLTTKTVSRDFPLDQGKVYSAMNFFWIAITMVGALGFGPLLAPLTLAVRLQIAVGALLACAVFDAALARFVFPARAR